jgi:hypothetical protein
MQELVVGISIAVGLDGGSSSPSVMVKAQLIKSKHPAVRALRVGTTISVYRSSLSIVNAARTTHLLLARPLGRSHRRQPAADGCPVVFTTASVAGGSCERREHQNLSETTAAGLW